MAKKKQSENWRIRSCRCSGISIFEHEGRYFDLRQIFDRLNERHFRGRLRGYKVIWGRRRKHVRRNISSSGRSRKKIASSGFNPLLDQPFVPLWFLEYVLYHEMLHSVVPDEIDSAGRRRVHTENSIDANETSRVTAGRVAGKKKISRVFFAKTRALQRVPALPRPGRPLEAQTARVSLLRSF